VANAYVTFEALCLQADGTVFEAVVKDAGSVETILVDGLNIASTGNWIQFPEERKEYPELVDSNGKKFAIIRCGKQLQ
jgi:hypothetical protein